MGTNKKGLKNIERVDELKLINLTNHTGTELKIINFGASILSLTIKGVNVVVGPADPQDYLTETYHQRGKFFGATVGRHAGRISRGSFRLNDEKFNLFGKDGIHLHGGNYGFSYKFWKVVEIKETENPFVVLEYISPDGEEGYPGNLKVRAKYTLTEENEVKVEYTAETDKETIVNLTNHTYFNLNGGGSIEKHYLQIPSEEYLETDDQNVPTGKLLKTACANHDFNVSRSIGETSLDTVFKLQKNKQEISLLGDQSQISLHISTNQPAVVVYVPQDLPGDWEYFTKIGFERPAVCLETQKFPDAPHQLNFPSVVLKPGEIYWNYTSWSFKSGS